MLAGYTLIPPSHLQGHLSFSVWTMEAVRTLFKCDSQSTADFDHDLSWHSVPLLKNLSPFLVSSHVGLESATPFLSI